MKARSFQSLILAWSVLVWAGCHGDRPASSSQPLAVTEPCSPAPQLPVVFYDEKGEPSGWTQALSQLELKETIDWVARQTSDPVWLIRVKPSMVVRDRGEVIAYLVPDKITPRMRIGRAYCVPRPGHRSSVHTPWKYAQVLMPDHNSVEGFLRLPLLELPFLRPATTDPSLQANSPMSEEQVLSIFVKPPIPELPFRWPTVTDSSLRMISPESEKEALSTFVALSALETPFGWPAIGGPNIPMASPMSEEEVLSIADFVHQPSSYIDFRLQGEALAGNIVQKFLDSPIYDMRRSDDLIEVRFGYMHGFLWGHGLMLILERTPVAYKIKNWGSWIS